jgi:hypothetical protein
MKPNACWEAASRSATQEFPTLYGTRRYITVFTVTPPLVPILSQMNLTHTNQSNFSNMYFTIILRLHLGLSKGPTPSGFLTETLYTLFVCVLHLCLLILLELFILIILAKNTGYEANYAIFSSLLLFQLSWVQICPSAHSSLTSLNVRYLVSHPYKLQGRIAHGYI